VRSSARAKFLAGCACMGFGWEAQQTGKSTGGKGKAAGLYRGIFSAVRVCALPSACFEQAGRRGSSGCPFKKNLSYKAPKMALYNAAQRRFPICNTKSCQFIYYDALNCKVAKSTVATSTWGFVERGSANKELVRRLAACGRGRHAGHPRRPPDSSRQPCREEHRRQQCRLGERAGAPAGP
jgi:hypothetical protein